MNLRPRRAEPPRVDITPLIDVVFLMLIFFMVSTTFDKETQLKVDLIKNLVAAGLADKCEVQVSYAIGFARQVSIFIVTFGTGKLPQEDLLALVKEHFEMRPSGLISIFNLQQLPAERGGRFYQDIAAYGHFGRTDLDLPWERLDKVEALKMAASRF